MEGFGGHVSRSAQAGLAPGTGHDYWNAVVAWLCHHCIPTSFRPGQPHRARAGPRAPPDGGRTHHRRIDIIRSKASLPRPRPHPATSAPKEHCRSRSLAAVHLRQCLEGVVASATAFAAAPTARHHRRRRRLKLEPRRHHVPTAIAQRVRYRAVPTCAELLNLIEESSTSPTWRTTGEPPMAPGPPSGHCHPLRARARAAPGLPAPESGSGSVARAVTPTFSARRTAVAGSLWHRWAVPPSLKPSRGSAPLSGDRTGDASSQPRHGTSILTDAAPRSAGLWHRRSSGFPQGSRTQRTIAPSTAPTTAPDWQPPCASFGFDDFGQDVPEEPQVDRQPRQNSFMNYGDDEPDNHLGSACTRQRPHGPAH